MPVVQISWIPNRRRECVRPFPHPPSLPARIARRRQPAGAHPSIGVSPNCLGSRPSSHFEHRQLKREAAMANTRIQNGAEFKNWNDGFDRCAADRESSVRKPRFLSFFRRGFAGGFVYPALPCPAISRSPQLTSTFDQAPRSLALRGFQYLPHFGTLAEVERARFRPYINRAQNRPRRGPGVPTAKGSRGRPRWPPCRRRTGAPPPLS